VLAKRHDHVQSVPAPPLKDRNQSLAPATVNLVEVSANARLENVGAVFVTPTKRADAARLDEISSIHDLEPA